MDGTNAPGFGSLWGSPLEESPHVAAFEGDILLLEHLVQTEEDANLADATGATPLHHAARGKHDCVSFLLGCGADVEAQTEVGKTALHIAAYQGALKCAKLLVASSANVDVADQAGETALHKAATYDHVEVVRFLCDQGASVNLQTKKKKTALHVAMETGHHECAKILLENGAGVDMVDESKNTALHIAALQGHSGCIESLLQHSARRDLKNNTGAIALHNATFIGNADCTKLLCADVEDRALLDTKDSNGVTPMHHTCFSGYSESLSLLLEANADPTVADNFGYTALHLASYCGHTECVQAILGKLAPSGSSTECAAATARDNQQATALHKACFQGHVEAVKLLLAHGPDAAAAKDHEGATPLHKAAFSGHEECVKAVLEAAGDVLDVADNDGDTALHKAAFKGHDDCIDVLLQHKANRNLLDRYGRSPVHNSAASGNLSCLDKLVDETNVNLKDSSGRTPLHVAAKAGQLEAVEYLICKVDIGIDVNCTDNEGHSPLSDAIESAYEGIARELIVEAGASLEVGNCFELADRPQTIMSRSALEGLMEERKRRERMKDMLDPETRAKVSRLVVLFNNKPSKGLAQMIEQGVIGRSPKEIACFLHNHVKLSKEAIGELLGEEKHMDVLKAFTNELCFEDKTFEGSLRMYLSTFRLPGEAQKIDRIMETFAQHFYQQTNDDVFASSDAAFVLAFSVIMLNTDAHNPAIKKHLKMTRDQFVRNNRGINDGGDIRQDYLEHIYDRIIAEEIKMKDDSSVFTNAEKKGWLTKQGGRVKTWKRRWFVLTNNCLYYFKSPQDEKEPCGWIPLENLDIKPGHIKGKQKWTLTLQSDVPGRMIKSCKLVDGQVVPGSHSRFVISATTEEELKSWLSAINASMQDNPTYDELDQIKDEGKLASASVVPPPAV